MLRDDGRQSDEAVVVDNLFGHPVQCRLEGVETDPLLIAIMMKVVSVLLPFIGRHRCPAFGAGALTRKAARDFGDMHKPAVFSCRERQLDLLGRRLVAGAPGAWIGCHAVCGEKRFNRGTMIVPSAQAGGPAIIVGWRRGLSTDEWTGAV